MAANTPPLPSLKVSLVISFALALTVTPTLRIPDTARVAYIAQVYSQSWKTPSYPQVYVCDLHGEHKLQITSNHRDKESVHWIGKNKVGWVERERDNWEQQGPMRLVIMPVDHPERARLFEGTGLSLGFDPEEGSPPGAPRLL